MDFGQIIKAALDIITGKSDPFGEPKYPDVNDTAIMEYLTKRHFAEKEQGQVAGAETEKYPLPTTTPYPSPTPIPGFGSGSMTQDTNNFIEKVVIPMAKRYDLDPGIAAGQFAREGRLNGVGARVNNFYNIGVTDQMVAEAQKTGDWSKIPGYASPELGVQRYMDFISGKLPADRYANGEDASATGKVGRKQFEEAWKKYRHDPYQFLKTIGPTYSSSGEAYAENVSQTPEYQKYIVNKALQNIKQ